MGKPSGKKKSSGAKSIETNSKNSEERSPKVMLDEDLEVTMNTAEDLKEEGNKLFQKRDYEDAVLLYEKAIKLLPRNHTDVAYLHSNTAACYMQMEPQEIDRAIEECNLALEVSPKYNKALLKRAKCFEILDRWDLAQKDVDLILSLEPNNVTAMEISKRVKKAMEKKGVDMDENEVLVPEVLVKKDKPKKKSHKVEEKVTAQDEKACQKPKEVSQESTSMKLVFGDDIRWAKLPVDCSMLKLREIVSNKFPSLRAVLIKYRDIEGDLVTITTSEELRLAKDCADPQSSLRLYIAEVNPEHEPLGEEAKVSSSMAGLVRNHTTISENGSIIYDDENSSTSTIVDDYIVQFARLFKNHVGFDSDAYLNLHELGMKLYSEAMEDTVTRDEAHSAFNLAQAKFQEMTSLAFLNWGNVHMSRARKRLFLPEDASSETILEHVKVAFEWAQAQYVKAGKRYEEALRIKPDFYEALLALGQQQFEQARLLWCYATGTKADSESWPSEQVLELFNNAEDNMERGTEMWEEGEEQRLKKLSTPNHEKMFLQKIGLDDYFNDISTDEAAEHASNMRSQINILWGAMLYERSVVEYMLEFPVYEECLMAAVEKFKLGGASPSDLAVMIKNHCANETAKEGMGFKIDEIVQAWNELYDVKRWTNGAPSFRLEPLFRRQAPKLHQMLENACLSVYRRANQGTTQPRPEQESVLLQAQQQVALQRLVFQAGSLPTKVICLTQVVTADELKDDEDYEDIVTDMREEGGKYGNLTNIIIPRPGSYGELFPGVGKVFLEYADIDGSTKAKQSLNGRKFGGNEVAASFYSESKFAQGEYDG